MNRVAPWSAVLLLLVGCGGEEEPQTPAPSAPAAGPAASATAAPAAPAEASEVDEQVGQLQLRIETGNWITRASAARKLGNLGEAARPAIPSLRELIRDEAESWLVRSEAVCALATISPDTLPEIHWALSNLPPRIRWAAAYALGRSRASPQEVVPLLVEALEDPSWLVRSEAARSLASQGLAAVPPLRKALKDDEPRVQAAAAHSLGQLGEDAQRAVPDLQEALSDENWLVRSAAVYALGRMGQERESDVLAQTEAPDWPVRAAANQALREMGKSHLIPKSAQVPPEAERAP